MKARKYVEQHRVAAFVGFTLILVLVIGLAIIIPLVSRGGTPTPTPTPTPGVVMGPQACPDAVKDPAHWDVILGTQGSGSKVAGVSCANIMGNPSLQSLVTVRHSDANGTLDVYVFNNITSAKPTQIFKLPGLLKGDAKISGYNSVMTAEVDQNSSVNAGKPASQWTADLFREFEWNAGEGTLVQVAFPGIFPDLTRYQAENDQALVNKGQDTWKNDPQQVAQKLALKFFDWKRAATTKLLSGGGAQDVYATVQVQEPPVQGAQSQGPSAVVKLSRLAGNTHNFWVAIAVEDGTMLTLTNIETRSLITSPVSLQGSGAAFEAVIGRAVVYDHLYTDIGHAQITGDNGMGKANYSIKVVYNTSFRQGAQEGIVAVYEANGGISDEIYTAVIVKVLLDPEPGVALGPVSCPDAVQKAGYWAPIIGIDTKVSSVGTASCANIKGDPSLQALVPVYYPDKQAVDIYVYDHIADAHPVQLFKLQGLYRGGATISGYSTVLTAQVDLNSSINKDKSGDQLTTDLYREFKWSDGAGTLVQVAFPGFFPDLTRWEAERDQIEVNQGKNSWKLDALETTKRFAQALLRTPSDSPVALVSGGGAHDVDAVVSVTPPVLPGCCGPFPPIKVTLSRLEGNTNGGIWIVIGVESEQKAITAPQTGERLSSPVTVVGSGSQFESQVGIVHVLDHLYTDIGHAIAKGSGGLGSGPFSVKVPYETSFHGGAQEGIVVLYDENGGGASLRGGVAMVKVLLS